MNLDQEELTQRACMHNVDWTLVPPSSFSHLLIKRLLLLQSCYSDRKKASNLEAYVEWFNRLSYLVATEICMVSPELLDLHGGGGMKPGGPGGVHGPCLHDSAVHLNMLEALRISR